MELVCSGFGLSLILIGWEDWKWRRIWHAVTIPLCAAALWFAEQLPASSRGNALTGALFALGLFVTIWWLGNRWYARLAFGFGDVMLATLLGMIGGLLWGGWMLAIGMLT